MTQIDAVNGWLAELADAAGIDALELNPQGVAAVRFGDRAEIVFEAPEGAAALHLYCPVCDVPADSAAETSLYRRLLELNLFGLETRGASFAVDRDSNRVLLCYAMPLQDADHMTFQNTVGNFAEVCERFCGEFGDGAVGSSDAMNGIRGPNVIMP